MYIKNVKLKDFRNYKNLDLNFHKKVNIIIGKNAQGKTNLLESLYIMSLGKSFKTNKDIEMIKFGENYSKVKVSYSKNIEDHDLEIILGKEGKQIKIDGIKATKNSDILENMLIVIFSPEDLKIVKEEPEKRRKFIDRELCQLKPIYFKNLSIYKKILKQRNALLKQTEINDEVLSIWNCKLAEYGSKIILQRNDFIKKLNKISNEIHKNITNCKENLTIYYESNIKICENVEDQNEVFINKIRDNKKNDIFRRTTTVGPHKDDIKICVNDIDIRHYGSQGQQRTAALSLKLAEIKLIKEESNEDAVLLLDDVLSELDYERQSYLINSLGQVQLFITTTEIGQELKCNLPNGFIFFVENGIVKKLVEN
ncbi:DNA replication/repair protein RecF [Anaerovorax odorimutans]|uniref:DNA replication/repair protein RecF n=1 Tax=Anaerovorax odorimutans TaxID=109327 RepID=UPI0004231A88|nr:DNA replication/repair protein RecF [Anaerovorax odorimutans]